MRLLLLLFAVHWAGPTLAHPGHLADLAGHDHWVAGAAIGIAVVIGLLGALKGRKDESEEVVEDDDSDPAEASA